MAGRTRRDPVGQAREVNLRLDLLERRLAKTGSPSPVILPTAAGVIAPYAGATPPSGWLLCDGSAVSRTFFSELFTAIGTTFGAGDGSSTFNLPDLRGRVSAGRDPAQPEFDVLGEKGGEKTHKLTVAEMPSHAHDQYVTAGTGAAGSGVRRDWAGDGQAAQYPQGITTGANGGDGAHNNLQPYLVTNHIISTGLDSAPLPPATPDAPLPQPLIDFGGDSSDQISAAGGAWQDVNGSSSLTFGTLDRPLAVRATYNAQTTTTAGQAYAMIGVGVTGALTVLPEYDQATGVLRFGYTPFTNAGQSATLQGEKRIVVPAGAATYFRLQARRSTTTGITAIAYGKLELIPERWA